MIVSLTGNNSYSLNKRLREIVDKFKADFGELAIERIDGEESDAQAITDAVQGLPFLTAKKLVIVRSLSNNKLAAEHIEQIISSASPDTDVIFYEPITDKRTVFYKTLKAKTQFEELDSLDSHGLAGWLVGQASVQGGELTATDARYLIDRVGQNQTLLANELAKLITYSPKVDRKNIDLLTEKTPQSKVFDLMDAVFAGNKARALQLYEEQRSQKVDPQAILAMLAWQLNVLAVTKYASGKSPEAIAKDVGMSPFPISKVTSLARRLTPEEIKKLVNSAHKIDKLSKTKSIDLDEALKTYIATIA